MLASFMVTTLLFSIIMLSMHLQSNQGLMLHATQSKNLFTAYSGVLLVPFKVLQSRDDSALEFCRCLPT